METLTYPSNEEVESEICQCQKRNHIQQVAFSTFHNCLTQICFTCQVIRTALQKEEYIDTILRRDSKENSK